MRIRDSLDSAMSLLESARMIWRAARWSCAAYVTLAAVQGVVPLATLWLTKKTVDAIVGLAGSGGGDFLPVLYLVVGLGVLALCTVLLRTLSRLLGEYVGHRVSLAIRRRIHERASTMPIASYEDSAHYDVLARALDEAPWRPFQIVNDGVSLAQHSITLMGIAGFIVGLHWGLALVVAGASLPAFLLRLRSAADRYKWHYAQTESERRLAYLNWLLTGDAPAGELRLFGLAPGLMQEYGTVEESRYRERRRITVRESRREAAGEGLALIGIFGSWAFVALRAATGSLSVGDLVMYIQALQRGQSVLHAVLQGIAGIHEGGLFMRSYNELVRHPRALKEPLEPQPIAGRTQSLAMRGVVFGYRHAGASVLKGVDLEIVSGRLHALVGVTGSGKSTVHKILSRLYDPDQGEVLLNGADIRNYSLSEYYSRVSAVLQQPVRYQGTMRQNIITGVSRCAPADIDFLNAARDAAADSTAECLAQSYDTTLGAWFGGGVELSGGQWQTVALARALLRQAEIVLLDEPTSGMDPHTERRVLESLRLRSRCAAILIISHRPAVVRFADYVSVLDRGTIVESGPPDSLIAEGGVYASLFGDAPVRPEL